MVSSGGERVFADYNLELKSLASTKKPAPPNITDMVVLSVLLDEQNADSSKIVGI